MAELSVELTANIEDLKAKLKQAEGLLKDLDNGVKTEVDNVNKSFRGINTNNEAFKQINKATGGIAGDVAGIANGFRGASVAATSFNTILAASGIGAVLIGVTAIAVYWRDIVDFISGVNRQLERQKEIQDQIVKNAEFQVEAINAQLSVLKLQGKTDKEINALKRNRLTILLQEKLLSLEIAKSQLQNNLNSEKATTQTLKNLTKGFVDFQTKVATGFDFLFKTNFADDIRDIYKGSLAFFAGDDSKEATKGINDLNLEILKLGDAIAKTKLSDLKLDEITITPPKLKINLQNNFQDLAAIFGITKEGETALNSRITALGTSIQNSLNNVAERNIRPAVDFATLQFQRLKDDINQLAEGSLSDALANLGSNIGEALASGGNVIGAIGESLLGSFGEFLKSFGKLLIQYGVAGLAFSIATKGLTNPITAGPSAIALIAAGSALSLIGGAIGGALKGGLSGGGSGSGVSGQGSSNFSGASGGGGGGATGSGVVVFEIAGEKLVGVLSRTLDRNKRLGGNLGLVT